MNRREVRARYVDDTNGVCLFRFADEHGRAREITMRVPDDVYMRLGSGPTEVLLTMDGDRVIDVAIG